MVDRIPYAFLDEVSPNMKRDLGPLLGPSISQEHNALRPDKPDRDFSTDFPPEAVGKVNEYGLNRGPPIADRAWFMHNNRAPKDERHPVMVPAGYKNKRYKYYNTPMHRRYPNFRKKFLRIPASSRHPQHHNTMIKHRKQRRMYRSVEPFEDGELDYGHFEGFGEDEFEGGEMFQVGFEGRSRNIWRFLTHVFMGIVLIVIVHSIMISKYGR